MKSREWILVLFFYLVASALLFLNLGRIPLFEPDEGRYADIALTMVKTGDWITPRMNSITHLHKPPLSSWLVAASFKLLGPSEWSARLPSVLLSLLILGGILSLGKFLFDFKTGFYTAWILLTSIFYLATSRLCITDMALTFFVFLALNSAAHLFFGTRRRPLHFYLFAFSLALGMLTKGPVAWMVALLPPIIFGIWKKRGFGISLKHWIFAAFLTIPLSLSWYVLMAIKNPATLDYFVHYQLLGRVFKGATGHAHPFYYYLIVFPLGFFPWTLSIWETAASSFREKDDKIHFLWLWFVIPFVLFSIFRTKLATYVVPLFPAIALLVGRFWQQFESRHAAPRRPLLVLSWFIAFSPAIILMGGLTFVALRPEFVAGIPLPAFFVAGVFLVSLSVFMGGILRKKKYEWIFRSQAGLLVGAGILAFAVLPSIRYKNAKVFADKIKEMRRPGDVVLMYDRYFATLPFYLGKRVITVGVPLDAPFDPFPISTKYIVWDDFPIKDFVEGKERVFVLTDEKNYKRAQSFTKAPFYPLLREQGLVLFSNRP